MRLAGIRILVLVGIASLAACGDGGPRYANEQLRFSIVLPEGWDAPDLTTRPDRNNFGWEFGLSSLLADAGGTDAHLEVSAREIPDGVEIEEVYEGDRRAAVAGGLPISAPRYLRIGRTPAVRYTLEREDDGVRMILVKFSVLARPRLYHLSFICREAEREDHLQRFDRIARTFRSSL